MAQTFADKAAELSMVPQLGKLVGDQVSAATAPATASTFGTVKKGAAVTNCTVAADGTSAGTQLNALLVSLRAAGVIS